MTQVLNYASPQSAPPPNASLRRFILFCGWMPMVVGFSILLAFEVTHWEPFPFLGLLWIAVGTIVVAIGTVMLLTYLVCELRVGRQPGRTLLHCFLMLVLLLSNFPAAWLCILMAAQGGRF